MHSDTLHVQHPRLHEYTQACTPLGVLSAIYVACNMEIPKIALRFKHAQVTPQELQQLRKFVGKFNWHSNQHPLFRHILKALPIYEVYKSNNTSNNTTNISNNAFVSVTNDRHYIPPAGVSESLLTEDFLKNTAGKKISRFFSWSRDNLLKCSFAVTVAFFFFNQLTHFLFFFSRYRYH